MITYESFPVLIYTIPFDGVLQRIRKCISARNIPRGYVRCVSPTLHTTSALLEGEPQNYFHRGLQSSSGIPRRRPTPPHAFRPTWGGGSRKYYCKYQGKKKKKKAPGVSCPQNGILSMAYSLRALLGVTISPFCPTEGKAHQNFLSRHFSGYCRAKKAVQKNTTANGHPKGEMPPYSVRTKPPSLPRSSPKNYTNIYCISNCCIHYIHTVVILLLYVG